LSSIGGKSVFLSLTLLNIDMVRNKIVIRGAKQHNLKNIDVDIHKNIGRIGESFGVKGKESIFPLLRLPFGDYHILPTVLEGAIRLSPYNGMFQIVLVVPFGVIEPVVGTP